MEKQEERLARWLDLLGYLLRQPLADLPYDVINAELADTLAASAACLYYRAPTGEEVLRAWPAELTLERLSGLAPAVGSHPIGRWFQTTHSLAPCTMGRVPSAIADERSVAVWVEASRPYGLTQELAIPLHIEVPDTGALAFRTLVVARPDDDFNDADLELARRLQPVLVGLERQAAELARWRRSVEAPASNEEAEVDGAHAAAEEAHLTGRELAVLSLLAEGHTATAIARRLGIATRTVHKHLEHVYVKLGTGDRLTAVLRARQRGLLPTSWHEAVTEPHGEPAA
jgi:DNA-binding CsgD family transcriptional regulator